MKKYQNTIVKYNLVKENTNIDMIKVNNSHIVADYLRKIWDTDINICERFYVLYLNRNNKTIGYKCISQGGLDATVVDVRLIAKYAIESLASSVIIAHNHPSGNIEASTPDKNVTNKIKSGLNLLDIRVLDHIILSDENYYSFADNGIL